MQRANPICVYAARSRTRPRTSSFCLRRIRLPSSSPRPFAQPPPPRYPDWVLLDTVARGANYCWESATSAEAVASSATSAITSVSVKDKAGVEVETEVEVSFRLVNPPDVSCFVVRVEDDGLAYGACVVSAEGDTVLLHISLPRYKPGRYFVYRAGHGNPSLEVLPRPPPGKFHPTQVVGILPRGGGGSEGYVVAAIRPKCINGVLNYELFLYSSKTKAWSTLVLPLDCDCDADLSYAWNHRTSKVIAVGADSLGWVDLWHGILVCNVPDEEDPAARFIQLPGPMPGNKDDFGTSSPRSFRDVICIGDLIKFVEVDYHEDKYGVSRAKSVDGVNSDSDGVGRPPLGIGCFLQRIGTSASL